MEFAVIAFMAVIGGALIAGGVVAYRGAKRTSTRVLGAAAIAAGAVMWALVIFVTPLS